jgi:G3E family GTPase
MTTPVPVTIITGFLGSGKTTLLNRILTEQHGQRIAVIENELGEAGIDNEILLQDRSEQIVETLNGCICCTVRGDLARMLTTLSEKRHAGALAFDRVVIETTGVADPAPVAQTFFLEEAVVREYRLDGVVTLVDAKNGSATLDEHREAMAQVGFADRILLSKTDLVPASDARELTQRLNRINGQAPVKTVRHGIAEVADVLDLGGFDLSHAPRIEAHPEAGANHRHADRIASFVYRNDTPFDLDKLESFMALLVERYGPDMLRYKGILSAAGCSERIVFQGVRTLFGTEPGRAWGEAEARSSTLVFIGRDLPRELFEQGLALCIAGATGHPSTVFRAQA